MTNTTERSILSTPPRPSNPHDSFDMAFKELVYDMKGRENNPEKGEYNFSYPSYDQSATIDVVAKFDGAKPKSLTIKHGEKIVFSVVLNEDGSYDCMSAVDSPSDIRVLTDGTIGQGTQAPKALSDDDRFWFHDIVINQILDVSREITKSHQNRIYREMSDILDGKN